MAAVIKNSLGESIELTQGNKMSVATRLLAFDGGLIERIPNIKSFEKKFGVKIFHKLEEGIKVKPYRTNIDGYGYIISESFDRDRAVSKADSALENLKDVIFNG